MSRRLNRFYRKRYNRARVDLPLASAAGSAAWSPAGRGAASPDRQVGRRLEIEYADQALPIVNRN